MTSRRGIGNLQPSPGQLRTLAAVVTCGTQKDAATALGISPQTIKNNLFNLYRRLGVNSEMEAAAHLGWVSVPNNDSGPKICGWIGYCSRSFNHKGRHSDFRALDIDNRELFDG